MVIRVALPIPLRVHFDYLCDKEVSPGCRVLVPFGKRELIGIVWQLNPTDSYDATQLKAVTQVLDQTPVLAAPIRQLLSFAADYYHYPLGEVLISALPALLREGRNLADYQPKAYQLSDNGKQLDAAALKRSTKQLALLQALLRHPLTESALLQQHGRPTLKQLIDKQLAEEIIVPPQPFSAPHTAAKGLKLTAAQAMAAQNQGLSTLNVRHARRLRPFRSA